MRSFAFSAAAALLACSIGAGAEPAGFGFSLEPPQIEPGQRSRLELRLPLSAVGLKEIDDDTELPQIRDDLLVDAPGIAILDRDFRRERNALVWRYDLTAYMAGEATIPPVEVRLGPHSFSTEARKLEVIATRAGEDDQLRPEFAGVSHAIRWGRWFRLLAFMAVAAALYHFGRRYLRRLAAQRPLRPVGPPAPPPEPLDAWLRRELRRLRARLDDEASRDVVVDDVTATLREYFARRDRVPARAWTTDEMRAKLQGDAAAPEIVAVFAKCDLLKFSGQKKEPREVVAETLDRSEKALLR